ncbi:MAG TPA: hypothetical protein VE053_00350 [Allosphingosinicella sp.]|nr:hypothetical protein [Allosphingosinicella sp.]
MYAVDHPDGAAMLRLTSIDNHWSQLAYQFGHELGHVLAGSWDGNALPRTPSHWVEEALAEACSLFILRRMAAAWPTDPPYPNWASYAECLDNYAGDRLAQLGACAPAQRYGGDLAGWYLATAAALHSAKALEDIVWPLIPSLVRALEGDTRLLASYGALNRWPERSTLPLAEYLDAWARSCSDLGLSPSLPGILREWLFESRVAATDGPMR